MIHEEILSDIFELRDGELSPARRAEAERHLASCDACLRALGEWERTAKVLLRPPRAEPSEAFVEAVMARVRAEPDGFLAGWRRLLTVPRLAFAGAASLLLVFALRPHRPEAPADPDAGLRYAVELLEEPAAEDEERADAGRELAEVFL